MAEQIHIGFGIDKNFGRFAGITVTSLVHNNIQHDLNIHIVYDELLPEDRERLLNTEQLYRNLTLHFYQITSTEGMTFVVPTGHITQAMYYRYLFADLLPPEITKILYLDADIICKGDILPLWQTDLQGKVLGAARLGRSQELRSYRPQKRPLFQFRRAVDGPCKVAAAAVDTEAVPVAG